MLDEMIREATRKRTEREEEQKEKGQHKTEELSAEEIKKLDEMVGAGGLKFFLVRVDPQKRMIFNPEESIELHGFTATFVQYAFARTQSVFRKELYTGADIGTDLLPLEKELILSLERYPEIIKQAGEEMNPSAIAGYVFNVAQLYNTFFAKLRILTAETPVKKELRLQINQLVAHVLKSGMALLGIQVPDRM
jgi:arginyl-tRNA synthetase